MTIRTIGLYVIIMASGISAGMVTQCLNWPQRLVLSFCVITFAVAFRMLTLPKEKVNHENNGISDKH